MTHIYNEDYEETQPQEGDYPVYVASYSEAKHRWNIQQAYGKRFDLERDCLRIIEADIKIKI